MEQLDELQDFLEKAIAPDVWENLINRGIAWSMMRLNGKLPEDIDYFSTNLDTDLGEYGFSVLRAALSLNEKQGDTSLAKRSFEKAARAFEAMITNADPRDPERSFIKIVSASAYHLADYSAVAFSLLNKQDDGAENNYTPGEEVLALLILRNMEGLRILTKSILDKDHSTDAGLSNLLSTNELEIDEAVQLIINVNIAKALAHFDFALQSGEEAIFWDARIILIKTINLASEGGAVTLWWICKICLNLISDLWQHSLHKQLPLNPPDGGEEKYTMLRELFITSLYGRSVAEVELWPSQIKATQRSTDIEDDLVVALPTSAGKTRIAEITALMTLSTGRRVVMVTPLRALSAQTERSFRKTFAPLGFSVSSLYGASGVSAFDNDALKTSSIVIATPEKLDFALRSDPSILDDIGLVILDEGHMIGKEEREIRYEILVQRLLRRSDAKTRRIVCLSAILPEGENLNDFTSWIRKDIPGNAVQFKWRPTRQRFGKITLKANAAHLNFDYKSDIPFLARFFDKIGSVVRPDLIKPADLKELTVFSAWKFAEQGKRTLIFVTQANWVEGFGKTALDLVKKGYLPSLLENPSEISRALAIGKEWLGSQHPAVLALQIGVAIHHGKLPNPFLRELELLLSSGVIKVTAASPTLSQGLNINAAVLLVPYLVRQGKIIKGVEFANVAGRAGRAFVDVEGFILHLMVGENAERSRDWKKLVDSARERTLTSGLYYVLHEVAKKLAGRNTRDPSATFEYLSGSIEAWMPDRGVTPESHAEYEANEYLIEKLDAMVMGLVEALDTDKQSLPKLLDTALKGSLWSRQVDRVGGDLRNIHEKILLARANLIWSKTTAATRRGYFAMGVGLDTGQVIEEIADELNDLVDEADIAAIYGEVNDLFKALEAIISRLQTIRPFRPDKELPDNWREILRQWISGIDIELIGPSNMPVIEEVFAYKMVWALEAIRVRRISLGWKAEYSTGGGAAALENGLPHLGMSMLIRAGLPSRRAAIRVVKESSAEFETNKEMLSWLVSEKIEELTAQKNWPTSETSEIWKTFRSNALRKRTSQWSVTIYQKKELDYLSGKQPVPGVYRLELTEDGDAWVCTPDFTRVIKFKRKVSETMPGIYSVLLSEDLKKPILKRFGRGKMIWERDE